MSYESYMEDRANASSLAPDELTCESCGHDKAFHEDASSNPMPCDKMVRRYGRMKLCGCEKFVVPTRTDDD